MQEYFFVKSQNSDHQNWSDFLLYKNLFFFDRLNWFLFLGVILKCQIFSAGRLLNRWVLGLYVFTVLVSTSLTLGMRRPGCEKSTRRRCAKSVHILFSYNK